MRRLYLGRILYLELGVLGAIRAQGRVSHRFQCRRFHRRHCARSFSKEWSLNSSEMIRNCLWYAHSNMSTTSVHDARSHLSADRKSRNYASISFFFFTFGESGVWIRHSSQTYLRWEYLRGGKTYPVSIMSPIASLKSSVATWRKKVGGHTDKPV